jgi:hypothetical protein
MSEPTAAPPPCVTPRDDAGLFLDARRPRIAPWTSIYTRKNQTYRPRIRAAPLITSQLNPETGNAYTGGRLRSGAQTRGIRGAQRPDTRRKTRIDRAEPARTHRQQARKEPEPVQMHKQEKMMTCTRRLSVCDESFGATRRTRVPSTLRHAVGCACLRQDSSSALQACSRLVVPYLHAAECTHAAYISLSSCLLFAG